MTVQSFNFLTSLGADDASSLLRDFGVNGRFQVRGSGGASQIETGDALGDDIGGSGRIGGWAGTQGVLLTLDYATVAMTGDLTVAGNLAVTGSMTVDGASPFVQLLTSGALSAATSSVIALDADFDDYILIVENFGTTGAATVGAVFSFDNGATYKTSVGDYAGAQKRVAGTALSSNANSTSIGLSATDTISYGKMDLRIFSTAGKETSTSGQVTYGSGSNGNIIWPFGVTNAMNFGKASHVRLATNTAETFTSGSRYALFGVPGIKP